MTSGPITPVNSGADAESTGSSADGGRIEFIQFHRPALPDGDYQIHFGQKVAYGDKIATDGEFSTVQSFRVAGERLHLNPTDIVAKFPPNGSTGDHSMVLPHLVLGRSTLPWERLSRLDDTETPWLALLVFSERDIEQLTSHDLPIAELGGTAENPVRFPTLTPAVEADPNQHVKVIDVPWAVLDPIVPRPDELRLLSHVRKVTVPSGPSNGTEETEVAVMMAGRLPLNDEATTVHLVSLEAWFSADGEPFCAGAAATDTIRLVSLDEWRFTCHGASGQFADKLEQLDLDPPYLRLAGEIGDDPLLDIGGAPFEHSLRDGGRTVSIYRGPLVGYRPTNNGELPADFPVGASDELLVYHEGIGLLDVSNAAAWELGRLLTLQSSRVAVELAQWKRAHSRRVHRARQITEHPHLPGHQRDVRNAHTESVVDELELPEAVRDWFDRLRLLEGLPFNYLVPDESMLPPESLRYFMVDPSWMHALLDGALSIGRVISRDLQADRNHARLIEAVPPMSGVLLRSSVVEGWPDLVVQGHDTVVADRSDPSGGRLQLLRVGRLDADTIICLFAGEALTIDIAQKPELLHFGVDVKNSPMPETDGVQSYCKLLRDTTGVESGPAVSKIPWLGNPEQRRLDVVDLAEKIRDQLFEHLEEPGSSTAANLPDTVDAALFGLEMIEGVERVRFTFPHPIPEPNDEPEGPDVKPGQWWDSGNTGAWATKQRWTRP